jgi:hypothetical protein
VAGAFVLAHQGGWDEILLVAGPVALFALLLWRANKRASRLARDDEESKPATPPRG